MARSLKPRLRALTRAGVFALGGASLSLCGAVSDAVAHDHRNDAPGTMAMAGIAAADASAVETPFLVENDAAMTKMMAAMAIAPTGDVDRDFVAMMVPHHQGAIDMATAVLRYGHNRTLQRLAQEIIVTQQQEIAAMRLAVDEALPPSVASPTQPTNGPAAASFHLKSQR